MTLLNEIRAKRTEILAIAAECGLKDIKVFGSVARGEERPDSDIDFLVTSDPDNIKGLKTFGFPIYVSELLDNRKVDMIFNTNIRPLVHQYIMQDAVDL